MDPLELVPFFVFFAALGTAAITRILARQPRHQINRRVRQLRRRARRTYIYDVQAGEAVLVVGRARAEADTVVAPLSGCTCLAYEAAIEDDDDAYSGRYGTRSRRSRLTQSGFSPVIRLEDESGKVLVRLQGQPTLLLGREEAHLLRDISMTIIDRFLEGQQATYDDIAPGFPFGVRYTKLPADYRGVEWRVADGDLVAVVGEVAEEAFSGSGGGAGTYRRAPQRLVLGPSGDAGPVLILAPGVVAAEQRQRLTRGEKPERRWWT